ncbi:MAG: Mu-like prophage major head subunit gpT family protein [Treponema sp.]|jgi:phage major head subunit gpT-like protein|nr:Mu-like prophage major head subunit gpT family protein [Treponema sp.]
MIITTTVLQAMLTSFKHEFGEQIQLLEAESFHKIGATTITSNSKSNTYGWMGRFPQLREWIGDRAFENVKNSSYVIENKKYEATLNVEREDIEDDNLGIYRPMAKSMADEYVAFLNRNLAALLKDGFTTACYDGKNFFDEHPVFAKADGSGTASDVSNIYGDSEDEGDPWFLLSLSGSLKPLIIQQRTTPEFENITDTKNDTVFIRDQYLYGIRYRGSFGYGFWQQAVASKEDLTPANYEAARLMMRQFRRDGGDPLGIVPTHLVVSAENESAARKILEAQLIDGGDSNINYHTSTLIVSPWL